MPPLKLATEESFGNRLARIRKERGFTQVALAEKIGIIQSLVTDYERDRLRLNAEIICRFAQALDVTTDELLGMASESSASKRGGKLSLKVVRRLKKIEELPSAQQKAVLSSIDMLLVGVSSQAG